MSSREEKDKKWEQVQIKAFKSWFNTVLTKKGREIVDIKEDMKDGVALCMFLEAATGKKLGKWKLKPSMKVHMIENLSIGINHIKNQLAVRLVGIGAEDIYDGNTKLTLGLLWSLFRKLNIDEISEEGKSAEDGLLLWLQKMTEGYDGVEITNFKESFCDGMAFNALIHNFNPDLVDFDSLDPEAKATNLENAFRIAEEELGIPKLLDAEDMLDPNHVDERAVVLYSSLFFHSYVSNEKAKGEKEARKSLKQQLQEMKEQFEASEKEKEQLKLEMQEMREKELASKDAEIEAKAAELAAKDTRIAELEARIKELEAEVLYLRSRTAQELQLRAALEEKVSVLEGLIHESTEDSERSEEESARIKNEMHEMRTRQDKINEELESLQSENTELLTDAEVRERRLREVEERKKAIEDEMQALRDRIARETELRKKKAAEVLSLQKSIEGYKQRQIVTNKARVGFDSLKKNLQEHLEDLYRWRDLNAEEFKEDAPAFDLSKVIEESSGRSFEDQIGYLDGQLQAENKSLTRIIQLADSKKNLQDLVLKSGWLTMKGRKEWKKRWFQLTGAYLNYYEDEESEVVSGSIKLDKACDVVRQKAIKEEGNAKKLWPLKITIGERRLFVRAATKKERHAWFLALTSKIAHLSYVQLCEDSGERPDTRVLNIFSCEQVPSVNLNGLPLSTNTVQSLVKGIPGRDEVAVISIKNAGIDDAKGNLLGEVLGKLANLEQLNLSENSLGEAGTAIVKSLANNANIKEIDLSNNQICDAAVEALAGNLAQKKSLVQLNLSNNKITGAGAEKLCASLAEQDLAIAKLQLSGNAIGDAGAAAIATLIGANKNISTVEIANAGITDEGAKALAKALTSSLSVNTVDFSNNEITAEGAIALREAFTANAELQSVNLSGNTKMVSGEQLSQLLAGDGMVLPQLSLSRP